MGRIERVDCGGLKLAVQTWGEPGGAPPLVLLHGIGGMGSDWAPIAEVMACERLVLAPDARGHGASDWSADEAYHTDAHFADVTRLLDVLGIERCVLGGYSMGGGIAILAGAALGDRVAGVVVVDAYPAPDMTAGSRRIAGAVSRYATQPIACGARPRFDPAIARHMADDLAAGRPRTDLWPFWEMLECPVLVVRGAGSDVLPARLAAEMLQRQPRARLEVMNGTAHQVIFARPRELAEAMRRFVTVRCCG